LCTRADRGTGGVRVTCTQRLQEQLVVVVGEDGLWSSWSSCRGRRRCFEQPGNCCPIRSHWIEPQDLYSTPMAAPGCRGRSIGSRPWQHQLNISSALNGPWGQGAQHSTAWQSTKRAAQNRAQQPTNTQITSFHSAACYAAGL
jgi:hypothetical protein